MALLYLAFCLMLPAFISCFIATKMKERPGIKTIIIVYDLEEFTSRHVAMLFIGASSLREKKSGRVS